MSDKRQIPLLEITPIPVRQYITKKLADFALRQAARIERRKKLNRKQVERKRRDMKVKGVSQ